MSEVFENDIDNLEGEDLAALEDGVVQDDSSGAIEEFVYPDVLFKLKLEYSSEGIYATIPAGIEVSTGDCVIIQTRYGRDLARVMGRSFHPVGIRQADIVMVDRKATPEDLRRSEELKQKEVQAFKIFQEKVAVHKLDMKLIATHYLLEEQKALFFFSADNRVDFRELVKDLVSVFKMRIELRQIGVRDESRITGGLGVCGRPYCCHSVSDRLRPVSIRMAKEQNLSLNSMKISGQCGRLLCCLSYEYDWYIEARKKLPPEGLRLVYDGTNFRITEVNPLTSMIKMIGEDGRMIDLSVSRFTLHDGKWHVCD
jgi:cell fate regulator YaaT (PSP1 superfamily)